MMKKNTTKPRISFIDGQFNMKTTHGSSMQAPRTQDSIQGKDSALQQHLKTHSFFMKTFYFAFQRLQQG